MLTLVGAAALSATPAVDVHGRAEAALRHGMLVLLICALTWLCIGVILVLG